MFLEISQRSQENTCARVSFLIKLHKKETLAQVFSCEFCGTSKNTFLQNTFGRLLLIFQGFAYFLQPHILRNSSEWLLPEEHEVFFLMSKIKLSTHIHPSKANNKSIEIKHDICSKLHVMFENYMFPLSLPML